MMKLIFYLLAIFTLAACNSNTIIKKPDNLLSKEKMAEIITESYIARSAQSVRNKNNDRNINYLSFLYEDQGTDSITFNQSLEYYTADISLNEEILKLVQNSIDTKLNVLKAKKDSIFNIKVDSLEKAQEVVIKKDIALLNTSQKEELTKKIDSIKKHQGDLFSEKISALQKSLKDTVKLKSSIAKKQFVTPINKQIVEIKKIKTDSINKIVDKIKELHQKNLEKQIESIKKKQKDYTTRTKMEFERKKY